VMITNAARITVPIPKRLTVRMVTGRRDAMLTNWPRSHDEIALELDSIQDERPTEDCKYGHYLCSEEYMGPCTEERESRLYVELANAD